MELNDVAKSLWAKTRVAAWPERYVLVSFPRDALAAVAALLAENRGQFAALVVEADEVSVTVEEGVWNAAPGLTPAAVAGPYTAITLGLDIDLGVCGYLLPAAALLADAGISIVPQCAYLKDHLLVRAEDAGRAVEILEGLVLSAKED